MSTTVSRSELSSGELIVAHVSMVLAGGDADGIEQSEFYQQCKGLAGAELVEKVLEHTEVLLAQDSVDDVKSSFQMLTGLVCAVAESERAAIVTTYTKAVLADPATHEKRRLQVVRMLFNALGVGFAGRMDVYRSLLEFAVASGQFSALMPHVAQVSEWLPSWKLDKTTERELLLLLGNTVREHGGDQAQSLSHKLLSDFITSYEDADVAALASVKDDAAQFVAAALRTPVQSFVRSDIMGLKAVAQLNGDATHGTLYAAAQVFATGRLTEYRAFEAAHPGFLGERGIAAGEAEESIRLLTLCSLASEQEQLSYADLATALEVSEDDVEAWVVKAIEAQLLDAKMDQMRRMVIVTFAAQRAYTMEQWKAMHAKLGAWTTNVRSMLGMLLAARQRAADAAAAQTAAST